MKIKILHFSKSLLALILFSLLTFVSCKKYETETISGNIPAKDTTIDLVLRDNYIQKAYLDLIGRAPTSLEKIGARTILDKNNCSIENREALINLLMSMSDYKEHLFSIDNAATLNSSSDLVIGYYITYYAKLASDSTQPLMQAMYRKDVELLYTLRSTFRNFMNDSIDLVEMHKRLTYNPLFDAFAGGEYLWINRACTCFFLRKATTDEINNTARFLQGLDGYLLGKSGNKKEDMITIFFNSREYFDGQIRTIFLRYLFHEPGTIELQELSDRYQKDHNLKGLLKYIFLGNEYLHK